MPSCFGLDVRRDLPPLQDEASPAADLSGDVSLSPSDSVSNREPVAAGPSVGVENIAKYTNGKPVAYRQ